MMRLTAPGYLALLVLLWWVWSTAGRRQRFTSGGSGPRWRAALRCVTVALLILAVSGLEVMRGRAPLSVMMVVDASDSVAGAGTGLRQRLNGLLAQLRPGDRAGVVVFGATPSIERALSAPAPASTMTNAEVLTGATDIESALRLARTTLPLTGARRIVLLSDGQQTSGDAMREASFAASQGVAVDVIPVGDAGDARRFVVWRVSAPATASLDEPFSVTATAGGPPGARGEIVIEDERGTSFREEVRFSPDGFATVTRVARERDPGVYVYRAIVRSLESEVFVEVPEPPVGAVVTVSGRPRLLYVGTAHGQVGGVLPAFAIDSITPARLPRSAALLASYDAVLLDDLRTGLLDEAQMSAIASHVQHRGGGLFVLGSERSLDANILPDGEMGKLLPIDLRPRVGVRAPELALVVLFDKSGSMDDRVDGAAKIEFARQGVRRVLEALPPTDAVGVIAFDGVPTAVAPLSAGHDLITMADRLRGITPGGSTAIAPAMRLALEWLADPAVARISRRHILLVSDGRSSSADAEQLQALVQGGRFQLSVISLGADRDRDLLSALAKSTGGRAYFPDDVRELPSIAAREATRVAGGRLVEESFIPRASSHPIANGIDADPIPRLNGYVVSAPKAGAELVLSSHRGDPILATWKYGLGRVAVYTADVHSAWSAPLRASSVFGTLMTQTVRWLARSASHESLYARFDHRDDRVGVVVDATAGDDRYISLLDSRASVRRPSGEIEQIRLFESLPGRYEGSVTATQSGAYVLSLEARSSDGAFAGEILRGFYWSGGKEHRTRGVNVGLLNQLTQATGGALLRADTMAFSDRPPSYVALRGWLLGAAFLAFLVELLAPAAAAALRGARSRALSQGGHEAAA